MITVLVVQDSASISMLVKFTLESAGFSVVLAETGKDAVERVKEGKIDIILLDYSLTDMDGDQVCAILKREEWGKQIPVLFMSAKPEKEIAEIVQKTGADGYIGMAWDPDLLVAAMNKCLAKRGH